jgi:hypothetical protein
VKNRKVIIVVACIVCALSACTLFGFWATTDLPGAKEMDYRSKQEDADRRAHSADSGMETGSDQDRMVARISEQQTAATEARRYAALANEEMNHRVARNERLLGSAVFLGLMSVAGIAVLFLPRLDEG